MPTICCPACSSAPVIVWCEHCFPNIYVYMVLTFFSGVSSIVTVMLASVMGKSAILMTCDYWTTTNQLLGFIFEYSDSFGYQFIIMCGTDWNKNCIHIAHFITCILNEIKKRNKKKKPSSNMSWNVYKNTYSN